MKNLANLLLGLCIYKQNVYAEIKSTVGGRWGLKLHLSGPSVSVCGVALAGRDLAALAF